MDVGESSGLSIFQWGGTLTALFLLFISGQRSSTKANLLVLYLLTSFPTLLFNVLRGEFGKWIAFLAMALQVYFPETFPGASRFILFVVTPASLSDRLQHGTAGVAFCLVVLVFLVVVEIRDVVNSECSIPCFLNFLGIVILSLVTISMPGNFEWKI